MHISNNSQQMLQLAQSLTQSHNGHQEFQAGLTQQQNQVQTALNRNLSSQAAPLGSGPSQTTATELNQAVSATSQSMFNSLGNLNTASNLKDFGLLNAQQNLLGQVNLLNQAIQHTQMAAMQPATFIQVGMLLKLFALAELKYKHSQHLQATLGASSPEAQSAAEESQILLIAFIERSTKLVDPQKSVALSRFLKKGPLGDNAHEEDTDDEYGTVYNDVDAETDYIKRPRKFNRDMLFHYSMIT